MLSFFFFIAPSLAASLLCAPANLRTGPGRKYPTVWIFTYKKLPLKRGTEREGWVKVEGPGGEKGWIHKRMLSKQDMAFLRQDSVARARPEPQAPPVLRLEARALVKVLKRQGEWAHIEEGGFKGWVPCSALWPEEGP